VHHTPYTPLLPTLPTTYLPFLVPFDFCVFFFTLVLKFTNMPITRQATKQSYYEAILELLGCGTAANKPDHPIRLALDALDAANFFGLFTLARCDLALSVILIRRTKLR